MHLALNCRVESRLQGASDVGLRWGIDAEESTSLAVVSVAPGGSANHAFHAAGAADWQWTPEELPGSPSLDAARAGSLALALEPGATLIEPRSPGR
ncbi:hypothetical protein GCM10010403_51210 [Glycomyces rutgersensis]|uniref:Uncharacterized protein n=1 Tax=Glycomyces rutgersensis TaxID=58115 RepID=A0ABP5TEG3_9ACTN